MRKVDSDELKRLQIGILDCVADFCQKNDIVYWLDCGTLLGAIRHDGYIPWDDDIDLGMLRPDFDRFIHEFNGFNARYQVHCIENDPDFYFGFAKVLDMQTVLYEPDEKGQKYSINIDIFVYDNAPDDDSELKKAFRRRDFFRSCNILRNYNNKPSGNILRQLLVYIMRLSVKLFPKGYYCRKLVENAKRFHLLQTNRVGNFVGFDKMACNKRALVSFDKHTFEGNLYVIPAGYDEWLRSFYHDYMQLPPEEQRVTHHRFKAFIKDSEETNSEL